MDMNRESFLKSPAFVHPMKTKKEYVSRARFRDVCTIDLLTRLHSAALPYSSPGLTDNGAHWAIYNKTKTQCSPAVEQVLP